MINKNAYTLIEILVAISIFTIVIAAPTGLFVGSIKGQQKALASQKLLDNVSYSLEYISRALRMAKKDRLGTCIEAGANYAITRDGDGLKFINYKEECQEFFLDGTRLKESKNELPGNYLTSDDLDILSLNFNLIGQSQTDNLQPRVTLALDIKAKRTELKIQTTISQRNLDVQYQ